MTSFADQPTLNETQMIDNIREAHKKKVLVQGNVRSTNKQGFLVEVDGIECFCPLAKMDQKFIHIKSEYVGQVLDFIVEKIEGDRIFVSRVAALRLQFKKQLDTLEKNWRAIDHIFECPVIRLSDTGATIDLGGIEGFVPKKELSHTHIGSVAKILKVGDTVRAKIIQWRKKSGRHDITLSIKATETSPWERAQDKYKTGQRLHATIARKTEFGVFVNLEPGIDGLVHKTELSWSDDADADLALAQPGDAIEVFVKNVNAAQRRIALSRKFPELDPWRIAKEKLQPGNDIEGEVLALNRNGVQVLLPGDNEGFLSLKIIQRVHQQSYRKKFVPGCKITVRVGKLYPNERKIVLTLPEASADTGDRAAFREYQKKREAASRAKHADDQIGTFGELLKAKLNK